MNTGYYYRSTERGGEDEIAIEAVDHGTKFMIVISENNNYIHSGANISIPYVEIDVLIEALQKIKAKMQ